MESLAETVLAKMHGGDSASEGESEPAGDFDTAATEAMNACKAGNSAEFISALRAAFDIAFSENEKQPHDEGGY